MCSESSTCVFLHGDIQTVRIPDKYGFQTGEVYIPQDPPNEDLIVSDKPPCHRSLRCLRSWMRPEPLASSWIMISPPYRTRGVVIS